jgi:hypothetical protein
MLRKKSGKNSVYNILKNKKMKYLGINLTKKVKALYKENIKSLKEEFEENRSWKDLTYSWIGRIL